MSDDRFIGRLWVKGPHVYRVDPRWDDNKDYFVLTRINDHQPLIWGCTHGECDGLIVRADQIEKNHLYPSSELPRLLAKIKADSAKRVATEAELQRRWLAERHGQDIGRTMPSRFLPASRTKWEDTIYRASAQQGPPGVVRRWGGAAEPTETYEAFDERGRLVGILSFGTWMNKQKEPPLGLIRDPFGGDPIYEVWIVVRPDARRRGWGSRLYAVAEADGWPTELLSDQSYRHNELSRDGWAFQQGRRAKRKGPSRA